MTLPAGDPRFDPRWVGATFGGPDFNSANWKLGYQQRQFGVGQDPAPTGTTGLPTYPHEPSIYSGLASPSTVMTTAITATETYRAPAPQ